MVVTKELPKIEKLLLLGFPDRVMTNRCAPRRHGQEIAEVNLGILRCMQFELRQLPEPSPPPIKEPPDGPENPDVPVQEPDPTEPFQI